jgi:hypothetical protein
MRTGRPIPPLILTPTERETLECWTRRAKTAQAVAQRARLILGCAAGKTNIVVAHELWLTKQTVGKWRRRFLSRRLDGLLSPGVAMQKFAGVTILRRSPMQAPSSSSAPTDLAVSSNGSHAFRGQVGPH